MPSTFIENTNVSMSSLNNLKNTIVSTSATKQNTSLDALRTWFRTQIGSYGNFSFTSWNNRVGLSQFRERFIYGFNVDGQSESASKYANSNNGSVRFEAVWGDGDYAQFSFKVGSKAWLTPNTTYQAEFSGFSSGDYTSYAQHRGSTSRVKFTIRIGYGGAATYLITSDGTATNINTEKFFPVTIGEFG
jgi:hypothetical protein